CGPRRKGPSDTSATTAALPSFVSFSRASIVPSIVVVGQTLQRSPRVASSFSLCLCCATCRGPGSSPNLIAGKIKGHANGSLRVTLLSTFLEPRSDRPVSLGRGACRALDSRLLQLCRRRPCVPPYDTARARKNR